MIVALDAARSPATDGGNFLGALIDTGGRLVPVANAFVFVNLGSVCTHCLYNGAVGWSQLILDQLVLPRFGFVARESAIRWEAFGAWAAGAAAALAAHPRGTRRRGEGRNPMRDQVGAQPYPWPFDGPVNPEQTAVLCIDWQVDFCGPGGCVDAMGYDLSLTRADGYHDRCLRAHHHA